MYIHIMCLHLTFVSVSDVYLRFGAQGPLSPCTIPARSSGTPAGTRAPLGVTHPWPLTNLVPNDACVCNCLCARRAVEFYEAASVKWAKIYYSFHVWRGARPVVLPPGGQRVRFQPIPEKDLIKAVEVSVCATVPCPTTIRSLRVLERHDQYSGLKGLHLKVKRRRCYHGTGSLRVS